MQIPKLKTENSKQGYGVVELIFYISIFAVVTLVVINAMITMTKAFRETSIQSELMQSGGVMERIVRQARGASSIASIGASSLKVNTTDSEGAPKTVEFSLSGGDVQLLENNALIGNLNSPNITVSALSFTQITTAKGVAVKISMTLRAEEDTLTRSYDFYDTVVLRGGY